MLIGECVLDCDLYRSQHVRGSLNDVQKDPLYNTVSTPKSDMRIGIFSHVVYVLHSETMM